MSLATYDDLKSAIAAWLNREDLTARIPDFITLCEADLRRRVVHLQGLSDSGDFTMANQSRDLPEDFNGVIALLTDNLGRPVIPYRSPDDYFKNVSTEGSLPSAYTLISGKLYVRPWGTSATLTLIYKQKLDLVAYGPNWLLLNHPDLYLYGSMVQAAPYIVEDERLPMWKASYEQALRAIELDGIRQSTGGALQVRSNGPR